jgi:hypothetical protein
VSHAHLLRHLAGARTHVLEAVDGLDEAAMRRSMVPSGWTPVHLINHLAHDDEKFWISAVLGADPTAIAGLCDGWSAGPTSGKAAVAHYREQITRSDAVLAAVDLDAAPRWRPDPADFDTTELADGLAVVHRVLAETLTHAGHLDVVRELIDRHQHLVVT